jgi:cell pole-organizing protein PopZ
MLQPMLADWIERNLPDMVERLVQAEIRRMTDKG